MAHQAHNRVLDDGLLLNERATGTTQNADIVGATSGGTALVIDLQRQARQFAGLTSATNDTSPASYGKFDVVIDWTSCESGTGQIYYLRIEGNKTDSTFASTNFRLIEKPFGVAGVGGIGQPYATPARGRVVLTMDNVVLDNSAGVTVSDSVAYSCCRYIRVVVFCSNVSHTTGLAYKAWLVPQR